MLIPYFPLGGPGGMNSGGSSQSTGGSSVSDINAQMTAFRSYVSMLTDPTCKDENKLKAAQALSEDLEVCRVPMTIIFI